MQFINRIYFIFSVLALVGCANLPSSPIIDFTENNKKNYPTITYLTAIGSASSLGEAREYAQGNLAAIFSAKVEDDSIFSQNIQQKAGEKIDKSEYLSRSTLVSARINIDGVTIEEDFYDAEDGIYYALAVLNRREAEQRWLPELTNYKKILAETELKLSKELPPYQAIRLIKETNTAIIQHNSLVQRLRIVNPQGGYVTKANDSSQNLRKRAKEISFSITSPRQQLINIASASFVAEGMQPITTDNSKLNVSIVPTATPGIERDEWFIYREEVTITVDYEGLASRTINWKIQASSIDQQTAKNRLADELNNKITKELFSAIIDALNG